MNDTSALKLTAALHALAEAVGGVRAPPADSVREYVVVYWSETNNIAVRVRAYSRSEALEQWKTHTRGAFRMEQCIPFEPDQHGDFDTRFTAAEWDATRVCFSARL